MGEPCCYGGPCCYYKSGLIITSQVLSIVALITSLLWIWAFFMGLVVMIIQQVLYCCRVPKAVIWVLVFASLIPAALNFYAIYAFEKTEPWSCNFPVCILNYVVTGGVGITTTYVSGVLWVISGVLDLVYLLKGDDDDGEEDEAVAVAVNFQEDV